MSKKVSVKKIDESDALDNLKNRLGNVGIKLSDSIRSRDEKESARSLIENYKNIAKVWLNPPDIRNINRHIESVGTELYYANDEPYSLVSMLISTIIAIFLWLTTYKASPLICGDSWVYVTRSTSLTLISVLSMIVYWIACVYFISSLYQANETVKVIKNEVRKLDKKINKLDSEVVDFEIWKSYLSEVIALIEKYENKSDLVVDAVDTLMDIYTLDFFRENKNELEALVAQIRSEVINEESIIKQYENTKIDKLTDKLKEIRELVDKAGVYSDNLSILTDKASSLIARMENIDEEKVCSIVNIAIPEAYKLCCSSSDTRNKDVDEVLKLIESKMDSMLRESDKKLSIEAIGTANALREIL